MRAVDIGHLRAGKVMDLTGIDRDALDSAVLRSAREVDAMHPGAGIAHAQRAAAVDKDGGIEVEGVILCLGIGGDGQPCAGCAGHNGGHAGKRVFAMGVVAAVFAGDVQGHMPHAAHDLGHAYGIALCDRRGVGFGHGRAISGADAAIHLDRFQLPVAGGFAGSHGAGGKDQQKHGSEHTQEILHDGNSFPLRKGAFYAHSPLGKCNILFIACSDKKSKYSLKKPQICTRKRN